MLGKNTLFTAATAAKNDGFLLFYKPKILIGWRIPVLEIGMPKGSFNDMLICNFFANLYMNLRRLRDPDYCALNITKCSS